MTAETTAPAPAAAPPSLSRRLWVFGGILLGMLLSTLDQSVVAAALPSVVHDVGGLEHFAWVFTGYGLTLSITTIVGGKLGDLFGHRLVYLGGVVVFIAGSMLCGLAGNMSQLIAFRVIQGIGGGALVVASFSLIGQLFEPAERAKYAGYSTSVFAVASVAGPLVGGAVTDAIGWRWVFYVNLPLGLLTLAVVAFLLPTAATRGRPKIDYTGAALLAALSVCVALLAGRVGSLDAVLSTRGIALIVAIVVLIPAWIVVERRAAEPMIPLSLFGNSTFVLSNTITMLAGFAILATVNFLPLFLQAASGASAVTSGLLLIPMMFGLLVASTLVGRRIAETKKYRWFPVASMAVAALASYLLSTMDADTPWPLVVVYSVLLGVGSGLSMQVFMVAVQGCAPPAQIGAVTAAVTYARLVGASFGISAFGAVFSARLATELPRHVPGDGAQSMTNLTADALDKLPENLRQGFTEAYADSLGTVFFVAVPVLLLALVLSLAMRDRALGE
ncbi:MULTISPECIES: MDR family MFS transporter [Streptomyces]|uniref:Major facilitator superfamily (MFS) profile domain-containing protein n=1 Tax=Streptomyces mordarskii TaxID=1226758 RepID=A0ABN1CBE4_9ACTN|nr:MULTISPECIES: MDR family MFS transporter [Streptomyces]QTI89794.1 MFS transporter [Streptomyces sp. AgN23]WJD95979.1 MDR family MFS transporter [Streptomyces antimycoticus]